MSSRFILFALLLACSGDANDSADAGPLRCEDHLPLTIGHCLDEATDKPCVSTESQQQVFLSIEDVPIISPIIGLQGSPMFVMAVQGQGIAPGEALDAAMIDVRIMHGDQDVGGYASRPILTESDTTPGLMTAPRLFVVSFFADTLVGEQLSVKAEVEDRNGSTWCSETTFEAGALIDSPPI